ncbi:MAG TPA: glycosyltransferase family 39 protein, partial [Anaerolineales bacterium]|nr:glycosyltransferase family 39 protein [Anaerolineales bacterium]
MPRLTFDISRFPLYGILLLAALLRLGWPALTEFKADEARLLALALDMAEFKSFALRGIGASVGLPNFPMSVWLYSMPLFGWKHPYSATLFLGALNTLAVYVCYRLTRRYWGEAAALTAALMFAVSPWAVIYSRKIWAQNLLPLFVLAYVGAALAAFVDRKRWFLFLHFVALAVVIQIHLSGLAFIPLTLILLVIFREYSRAAWKEIVLGLVAAGLTTVPFGIWVAQNANGGASLIANLLSRPAILSADSIRFAWMVLCGFDIHSLAGPNAFRDYLNSVPNIDLIRWLWGLASLAGL